MRLTHHMLAVQVRKGNGTMPAMFCVPLLVKDNFETVDMAACNGAVSLLDNIAQQDASQVGRQMPLPACGSCIS